MKYLDVPKEQLTPALEKEVKEQLKMVGLDNVESVEWTAEGVRVWFKEDASSD